MSLNAWMFECLYKLIWAFLDDKATTNSYLWLFIYELVNVQVLIIIKSSNVLNYIHI